MGIFCSTRWSALSALGLVCMLAACGDDDGGEKETSCTQADASSCAEGLTCEQVGSEYECLPPVLVSGRVIGAIDGQGIANATVVGLDANGAARTRVARSGADGSYELPVSVRRGADRRPVDDAITLRVGAAAHQPFPSAPRSALPIELDLAQSDASAKVENTFRVTNAATTVALIPLPEGQRGGVTVEGTVAASEPGGALVAAIVGDRAASTAVSDRSGAFVLFNVTPGAVRVEGYRAGLALTPSSVTVPASGLTGVTLQSASTPLSSVSGSVNVVNAEGGSLTSVILALASTFDPDVARGEAPAGLRATQVSGQFRIDNVPPGRYAVLAAFENDGLVRDPDLSIAGTDIVFVDVGTAGGTTSLPQSFKVTGALNVVAPGAMGVQEVAPETLSLSWADDSSEDGYELRVYDALGNQVHENTMVPRSTGSPTVTYTLDATAYTRGMLYQFRVWSYRNAQSGRTYIASTEDLKGVFQIAR